MKTLLITTHIPPLKAGAPRVYDALARAFAGDMAVLTASCDYLNGNRPVTGWESHDQAVPYAVYRLPRLTTSGTEESLSLYSIIRAVRMLWQVALIVKCHKPDAFIIGSAHRLGWLTVVLKRLFRRPVFLYLHGEEVTTQLKTGLDRRFKIALSADGAFVVSRFTAMKTQELGFSKDQICLVPNAVDQGLRNYTSAPQSWAEQLGFSEADPIVLSVGRLVERKGFDKLLLAWPQVIERHPRARLVMVGAGDIPDFLEEAARPFRGRSVHILRDLSDDALAQLYAESTVFILANRELEDGDTEGFGLVFLEAGLFSLPGIGGHYGGVPDAIIDGETGILIDSNDPAEITRALSSLLSDEGKRHHLAANAYNHAKAQTWQDRADRIRAFIKRYVKS